MDHTDTHCIWPETLSNRSPQNFQTVGRKSKLHRRIKKLSLHRVLERREYDGQTLNLREALQLGQGAKAPLHAFGFHKLFGTHSIGSGRNRVPAETRHLGGNITRWADGIASLPGLESTEPRDLAVQAVLLQLANFMPNLEAHRAAIQVFCSELRGSINQVADQTGGRQLSRSTTTQAAESCIRNPLAAEAYREYLSECWRGGQDGLRRSSAQEVSDLRSWEGVEEVNLKSIFRISRSLRRRVLSRMDHTDTHCIWPETLSNRSPQNFQTVGRKSKIHRRIKKLSLSR